MFGLLIKIGGAGERRVVDIETELSDGTFVHTLNVEGKLTLSPPPEFDVQHVSPETPARATCTYTLAA